VVASRRDLATTDAATEDMRILGTDRGFPTIHEGPASSAPRTARLPQLLNNNILAVDVTQINEKQLQRVSPFAILLSSKGVHMVPFGSDALLSFHCRVPGPFSSRPDTHFFDYLVR